MLQWTMLALAEPPSDKGLNSTAITPACGRGQALPSAGGLMEATPPQRRSCRPAHLPVTLGMQRG